MSIKVYQNVLNFARTAEAFLFLDGAGCSAEIPEDFWESLASYPENVQRLALFTHNALHPPRLVCCTGVLRRYACECWEDEGDGLAIATHGQTPCSWDSATVSFDQQQGRPDRR